MVWSSDLAGPCTQAIELLLNDWLKVILLLRWVLFENSNWWLWGNIALDSSHRLLIFLHLATRYACYGWPAHVWIDASKTKFHIALTTLNTFHQWLLCLRNFWYGQIWFRIMTFHPCWCLLYWCSTLLTRYHLSNDFVADGPSPFRTFAICVTSYFLPVKILWFF